MALMSLFWSNNTFYLQHVPTYPDRKILIDEDAQASSKKSMLRGISINVFAPDPIDFI
ncbi:hypothetical protein P4L29_18835 [Bacillus cereus]|nr:hypothetical protein [Bacillus cereus]